VPLIYFLRTWLPTLALRYNFEFGYIFFSNLWILNFFPSMNLNMISRSSYSQCRSLLIDSLLWSILRFWTVWSKSIPIFHVKVVFILKLGYGISWKKMEAKYNYSLHLFSEIPTLRKRLCRMHSQAREWIKKSESNNLRSQPSLQHKWSFMFQDMSSRYLNQLSNNMETFLFQHSTPKHPLYLLNKASGNLVYPLYLWKTISKRIYLDGSPRNGLKIRKKLFSTPWCWKYLLILRVGWISIKYNLKIFFNLYLNHSIISNEQWTIV